MVTRDFAKDTVTLHRGERLTLVNDSNAVHVVGPGLNTHIRSPPRYTSATTRYSGRAGRGWASGC
jgi:hypothetical protein